ncbi:MAG: cell division protein PerM [Cellulosimicrobium funkei]
MGTTSTTRGARTRTVEGSPAPAPVGVRRAPSGVLAALQALTLSLAVVVLPGLVAVLASSTGASEGTGWGQSVTVAAGFWLLGHGVPLVASGTTVTLVPLGLTALALFCCFASARRSAHTAVSAWVAGTVTYALTTLGVALLAGSTPPWGLGVAVVGGAVVGGLGLGGGILARPDAPFVADLAGRLDRVVPPTVRLGLRGGLLGTSLLAGASAVVVGAWLVAGRATSGDIVAGLVPGTVGGIVLALGQLAVLPNLVAWAGAWLVGPGFAVGEGSTFAPGGSEPGALPAIPLLGALPGDDWTNALTPWVPAGVVALGVVAGVFVWRRLRDVTGTHPDDVVPWSAVVLALAGVALASGLLVGLVSWLAGGAVGPGRLEVVGADALVVGALAAAEIGGGAALAVLWSRLEVLGRRHRDAG